MEKEGYYWVQLQKMLLLQETAGYMKRIHRWIPFLFISAVFLYSCEQDVINGIREEGYWFANSLVHRQLNGPVKSLQVENTISEFNREGYLVSYGDTNGDNRYTYEYKDGRVVTYTADLDYMSEPYVMNYEYKNTGKFIPVEGDLEEIVKLVPGLSASYDMESRLDYTFRDTTMKIIYSWRKFPLPWSKYDTTLVSYSGNLPLGSKIVYSSYPDRVYYNDYEYDSKGNITKYVVGWKDSVNRNSTTYQFCTLNEYLLISSTKQEWIEGSNVGSVNTTFTYNEYGHLVGKESDVGNRFAYSYEYDTYGNWIIRRFSEHWGSGAWGTGVQNRTITYFE